MSYRFSLDLAKAHIAELEREAQDSRRGRRPESDNGSRSSKVTPWALHLVSRVRRLFCSPRFGSRTPADVALAPRHFEFNSIAHRSGECDSPLAVHEGQNAATANLDSEMGPREAASVPMT